MNRTSSQGESGQAWAAHWIEDARASLPEAPPHERPACAARLAAMLFACGRDDEAEAVLSNARREAAKSGDRTAMARIEVALGDGAITRDNDVRAHGHLAAARRQLSPVPTSIGARVWVVEARLARAEGRPAPPWKGDDPDATHEDLHDPNERMDLGVELALEGAIMARLARDWAAARTHLERARELSNVTASPRWIALVEVEVGLYAAEVDDPGAAYARIRQAIDALGAMGTKRDEGRAMIRLAEMMSNKRVESEHDSAALWLGRALSVLGPAATWRDRSAIRSGFRAHGRRIFDRVMTEGTASRIQGFERARGALLGAIANSVEGAECALNDLEAEVAREGASDAVQSLVEQVREAALSMSASTSPAMGDLDRVVHDLIDFIGAALVERDRMRGLLVALSDIDAATDRDALPPLIARLAARILEADRTVVATMNDGTLELVGQWGEAKPGSENLWRAAAAEAMGRERPKTPSEVPVVRRSEEQPTGPVLVVPMHVGGLDGAIYADKFARKGNFREQDQAMAFLLAEYSAVALGRLRAIELAQRIGASRPRYGFRDVLGTSPPLLRAIALAKQAATVDSTVLVTGESGTGKELLAQAIHTGGSRAGEPFVGVNVAALPRELLEAELFGCERGVLAGARAEGNVGKLELAGAGTLLLEEIGAMPMDLQPKLLRAIQERVVVRLGGSTEKRVHARVIATTRGDLSPLVEGGKFRADLLYRLSTVSIELPPLRERPNDIHVFAQHYVMKFAERQRKRVRELGRRAYEELESYDWPGNVRELANVMEAEVSLLPPDAARIERLATRLAGRFHGTTVPSTGPFPAAEAPLLSVSAPILPLAELEKRAFLHALEKSNQSVARAAEALGVSKVTFYAKLRAYGMHPKDRFDEEGPTGIRRQGGPLVNPIEPFEPPTRTSTSKIPPEK